MTNCNLFFSSAFNFLYIIKAQATITFVKEWVFTNCVITIENDFWNDRLLSDKFLCVTLSHMSIRAGVVVTVALQQIDEAPNAQTSAQRAHDDLCADKG